MDILVFLSEFMVPLAVFLYCGVWDTVWPAGL